VAEAVTLPATISPLKSETTMSSPYDSAVAAAPGASDVDHGAVGRIDERLDVRRRRVGPVELAERDRVLAGNRDAEDDGAGSGRRATRRRCGRGAQRGEADDRDDDRGDETGHGDSG